MMVMGEGVGQYPSMGAQPNIFSPYQHRNFGADSLSEPKIVAETPMPTINPTMPRLPVKNESPNLSPRLGPEPELGVGDHLENAATGWTRFSLG